MQVDQTTFNDLSIFSSENENSVFHRLNFVQTNRGKFCLQHILNSPLTSIEDIIDTQETIKHFIEINNHLNTKITNGTIMVIEKYYITIIDNYPREPNFINSFFYKIFSKSDFNFTKYTLQHFFTFIKEIKRIGELLKNSRSKKNKLWNERIEQLLNQSLIVNFLSENNNLDKLLAHEQITYANFFRLKFKTQLLELIEIFGKVDAYLSLATATEKYNLVFPEFVDTKKPFIHAQGLHHLLLKSSIENSIQLDNSKNFLFLTGANMAGKSTFIKAVGVAVFLGHIGMSVPSKKMELSFFDGMLSNIHIVDNIFKNESYFFNEVQRIKNTVLKINDKKKWLILIDELFKGTNMQDAMKCSTIVIEGLQKRDEAVFILSTHLYEIGNALKTFQNIQFKYFETSIKNNELTYSYLLKDGISNDRLGYLILEKEGVVDLLNNY